MQHRLEPTDTSLLSLVGPPAPGSLGKAIVRLAKLASMHHQAEVAASSAANESHMFSDSKQTNRVNGSDPAVRFDHPGDGHAHREVKR